MVQADIDRAQVYLDRVVGEAADRLDFASDALGRSDVQRLICRALAESTGAELVLHGILDEEILPAGPLRMSDVWRIVPYENRAALMLVTPSEMLEILNENLLRRGNLQFMGAYGFAYDIEEQGGVRRAVRLRLADGSSPHPRQRLKLCVNSYVVASGGKRFNRLRDIAELPETRLQLLPVDTRSAVVDYLKAHKPVTRELLRKGEL